MSMTETVPKKRGRPFGVVYRDTPYFPEKVEAVRRMYIDEKKSFQEIGDALGMSRAGAYYLWRRWVEPTLPPAA